MTRPRLLIVLACLLAIAGCATSDHDTVTPAAAGPASRTRTGTAGQAAAAQRFAGAYVRFLDGAATAAALPDTTIGVRALAGQAGRVPAARRRGTLTLAALRAAQDEPESYVLAARDAAHTFYATIAISRQHGRWLVSGLTPPDFVQALTPPGPPAPAPAPGSGAPEHAARVFLYGYLRWLYGHGSLREIHDSTGALLAGLARRPPRVPLTIRPLRPKLVALAVQRDRDGWQALANVTDGRETYELVVAITQTRGRWLVGGVGNPR